MKDGAIIDAINRVLARFHPPISYYRASGHYTGDITDPILAARGPHACLLSSKHKESPDAVVAVAVLQLASSSSASPPGTDRESPDASAFSIGCRRAFAWRLKVRAHEPIDVRGATACAD